MFKNILQKSVHGVIVSGYTEKTGGKQFYQPMYRWLFFELEDGFAVFSSNDGDIEVELADEITCLFDIEESDIFTLMHITNEDLGVIHSVECQRDALGNLIEVTICTHKKNITLNSLTLEGFEISIA